MPEMSRCLMSCATISDSQSVLLLNWQPVCVCVWVAMASLSFSLAYGDTGCRPVIGRQKSERLVRYCSTHEILITNLITCE